MSVRWIPGEMMMANAFFDEGMLVDAGVYPMAVAKFQDEIETIVLTHCHFDHIAYVREIAHMCNAEVAIHEADLQGLTDDTYSLAMHFGRRSPGIKPDKILKDGDSLGKYTVYHTPGHTQGSICLYDRVNRTLISGDTVFTDGGFGRYDFPGGNRAILINSIERLSKLEINGLYPGHGEPVHEGGSLQVQSALCGIRSGF